MQAMWAILADDVSVVEGRFSILGVIRSVAFEALPGRVSNTRLVMRIVASPEEKGTALGAELRLVHPDGPETLLGAGEFSVHDDPDGDPPEDIHVIPVASMVFSVYGHYELRLVAGGRVLAIVPIKVVRPR